MDTKTTASATSGRTAHELLTTEEAAEHLRLSPRTLETYRVTGEGPRFCKLGKRVFYRRTTLDAWLNERERRSTSDPGPPPSSPTQSPESKPRRRDSRRSKRGKARSPTP